MKEANSYPMTPFLSHSFLKGHKMEPPKMARPSILTLSKAHLIRLQLTLKPWMLGSLI